MVANQTNFWSHLRSISLAVLLSAAAILVVAPAHHAAFAQTNISGDIAGTITDPSGAAIPGATITATNVANAATTTGVTGNSGNYRIAALPPGTYKLTVTAKGFETTTVNVMVGTGQVQHGDVKLTIGQSATTVEVNEGEPLLHTESADISTTFTQQQVQNLPNPGNDLTFVAQTAPGSVMNTQGGYGNFSTFGLPATSNTFTINGGYENDPFLNLNNSGATNLLLGNNDIATVTVTSNAYSPQFGGLGGAQVNEITRSGGNAFHGDATWWWNGSVMNGNDYFNNQSGTPRPRSNANQWAGAIGGPIVKDKTFFFFDTEGLRVVIPVRGTVYAPSTSFIAKTLANVAGQGSAAVAAYQAYFNEYTKNPRYAAAIPDKADKTNVVDFNANSSNFAKETLFIGRVDQRLGSRDNLFVHATVDKGLQPTATSLLDPIFNAQSPQPQYAGQLSETHTFSPNIVNQFVLAAIYYRAIFTNTNAKAANAISPFGIYFFTGGLDQNSTVCPTNPFCTVPGNLDFAFPQGRNVTNYQFVDDFSVSHGNHSYKTGFYLRRDDVTDYGPQVLTTPLVETTQGSFEAGSADIFIQQFPTRLTQPVALYNLGIYVADEWKARPNLTLTLGMRLEHNSNPICQTSCFAALANDFSSEATSTALPYNQLINSGQTAAFKNFQKVAWEPRFGFSWSPMGSGTKTVVRGGFGIFADVFPAGIADSLLNNAPTNVGFAVLGNFVGNTAPLFPQANTTSYFGQAAASNVAFQAGFKGNGSNDTMSASVPNFAPPGFTNAQESKLFYPTYEEYNLAVERQIGNHSSVSVQYVGNHGYHEPVNNNSVNAYNATGMTGFPSLPTSVPNANFSAVDQVYSGASSNYNGLIFTANRQSKSLLLQANYAYSHALDEISNGGFYGFSHNSVNPENPNNLSQNYGNADYDTRHYISGSYVFTMPYYGGPHFLTDGWQLAGTFFHSTGLPFTVTDGATSGSNFGNYGGALFAQQTTAHVPTHCFAIENIATQSGTPCSATKDFVAATDFGQQHRNQIFGPGYTDTDMSLMKAFSIPKWETARFQMGLQAFNLFNHPNFAQPANDINAGNFGLINSTVNPPTSILGSFLGGDASPRLLQVKLNFTF
ncbi:MAG: outer membrane beta-barrel protein [Acidobacteriaceae bacterium]